MKVGQKGEGSGTVDFKQLSTLNGFEWDEGNSEKNWTKHRVARSECEEVFFNRPLVVAEDQEHSQDGSEILRVGPIRQGEKAFRGIHNPRRPDPCNFSPRHESDRERDSIMKKKIPMFKSEDQERDFWSNQDSTAYLEWGKAKRLSFPNLKPSTKTISIRLPESMLDDLKMLANKRDVPYQSLLKVFLAERIKEEFGSQSG